MEDDEAPTGEAVRRTVVIRPDVPGRGAGSSDAGDAAALARRRLPSLPRPSHALVVVLSIGVLGAGGALAYSTRSSLEIAGITEGQRLTRRDLTTLTVQITSLGRRERRRAGRDQRRSSARRRN